MGLYWEFNLKLDIYTCLIQNVAEHIFSNYKSGLLNIEINESFSEFHNFYIKWPQVHAYHMNFMTKRQKKKK